MTVRHIRFREIESGLSVRCELLEDNAPESARFLWTLAGETPQFDAIHAMWTGPEISCPLTASALPQSVRDMVLPEENATSFPDAGDIVLAFAADRSLKGLPPGNFFDIGLFYGPGARLLMPFGWLRGNVAARMVKEDLAAAQEACKVWRSKGAGTLVIEQV